MLQRLSIKEVALYFLPVSMRVPLKFGDQVLTNVTCARVRVHLEAGDGKQAIGWGETPLSVGWVWPSLIDYQYREDSLLELTRGIADSILGWSSQSDAKSALELGFDLIEHSLPTFRESFNRDRKATHQVPLLASLVCFSPFDIALHDAFGNLLGRPTWKTYGREFCGRDLSEFFECDLQYRDRFVEEYIVKEVPSRLPVWHLVGGLDPIEQQDLDGNEPDDGYPVLLRDWIRTDGLNCLKIKLRGNDWDWDFQRLTKIGSICQEESVEWLTTDFNCMVRDPEYVNSMLDQLERDQPSVYQKILYVEQPFPHDLEANQIDVHSVSQRKPLFMDESAHDWRFVRLGKELGWNGVALKTCKTQTGAILSLCWAKANGMSLMVQDLTNPMLAQIPHFQLAAHAGTLMGVESNGMQFYPEASTAEQAVHPGLFQRRNGILDGTSLTGSGFGYRVDEINRQLPSPE